jgi:hypothetical protein
VDRSAFSAHAFASAVQQYGDTVIVAFTGTSSHVLFNFFRMPPTREYPAQNTLALIHLKHTSKRQ